MAIEFPSQLDVKLTQPTDARYWVNSVLELSNGLLYDGMHKWVKTVGSTLGREFILRNGVWVEVPFDLFEAWENGELGGDGSTPEHEWSGTQLRFRNPDGTWGTFTDLKGAKGDKGDVPAHEWSGTSIRFLNPNGTWGDYVNLQGPDGGVSVWVAYADDSVGTNATYTVAATSRFISLLQSDLMPDLEDFTDWIQVRSGTAYYDSTITYEVGDLFTYTIGGDTLIYVALATIGGTVDTPLLFEDIPPANYKEYRYDLVAAIQYGKTYRPGEVFTSDVSGLLRFYSNESGVNLVFADETELQDAIDIDEVQTIGAAGGHTISDNGVNLANKEVLEFRGTSLDLYNEADRTVVDSTDLDDRLDTIESTVTAGGALNINYVYERTGDQVDDEVVVLNPPAVGRVGEASKGVIVHAEGLVLKYGTDYTVASDGASVTILAAAALTDSITEVTINYQTVVVPGYYLGSSELGAVILDAEDKLYVDISGISAEGAYVPLTGTEVGEPITGPITFKITDTPAFYGDISFTWSEFDPGYFKIRSDNTDKDFLNIYTANGSEFVQLGISNIFTTSSLSFNPSIAQFQSQYIYMYADIVATTTIGTLEFGLTDSGPIYRDGSGSYGEEGQVLTSDGEFIYWGTPAIGIPLTGTGDLAPVTGKIKFDHTGTIFQIEDADGGDPYHIVADNSVAGFSIYSGPTIETSEELASFKSNYSLIRTVNAFSSTTATVNLFDSTVNVDADDLQFSAAANALLEGNFVSIKSSNIFVDVGDSYIDIHDEDYNSEIYLDNNDSRITSPTIALEGSAAYIQVSDALYIGDGFAANFGLGTSGQVLTSDGTKAIWANPSGGGGAFIPLSGTTVGNNVTGPIKFTDAFGATNYDITVSNGFKVNRNSSTKFEVTLGQSKFYNVLQGVAGFQLFDDSNDATFYSTTGSLNSIAYNHNLVVLAGGEFSLQSDDSSNYLFLSDGYDTYIEAESVSIGDPVANTYIKSNPSTVSLRGGVDGDQNIILNNSGIFLQGTNIVIDDDGTGTGDPRQLLGSDGAGHVEWVNNPIDSPAAGTSNVLFVNTVTGNNATAQRGNMYYPYQTVSSAHSAASAGDVIVVLTSLTSGFSISKNLTVIVYGDISYSNTCISVSGTAVANIEVKGRIYTTIAAGTTSSSNSAINVSNTATVYFKCQSITANSVAVRVSTGGKIYGSGDVTLIDNTSTWGGWNYAAFIIASTVGSTNGSIYWENSTITVNANAIVGMPGDQTGYPFSVYFKRCRMFYKEYFNAVYSASEQTITLDNCYSENNGTGTGHQGGRFMSTYTAADDDNNTILIDSTVIVRNNNPLVSTYSNLTSGLAPANAGVIVKGKLTTNATIPHGTTITYQDVEKFVPYGTSTSTLNINCTFTRPKITTTISVATDITTVNFNNIASGMRLQWYIRNTSGGSRAITLPTGIKVLGSTKAHFNVGTRQITLADTQVVKLIIENNGTETVVEIGDIAVTI